MTVSPRPLAGVRVLDVSTVVAGPGAARHLADYGADVIKVERPGGDSTRGMGWRADGDADSLYWHTTNRGKRSCVLDLKTIEGRKRLLELSRDADILIENMRPGRLEALGLRPAHLHQSNARLVILRVTGFGQNGPYAQKPGFATLAEAMSGFASLTGEPDGAPLLPPVALTDEMTAIAGAFAAMVAFWHAQRTGVGQVVDVNLLETMLQMLGPLPSAWHHLNYLQPRLGSGLPYSIPRGTYRCVDGTWVALSASAESVAQRVLAVIGVDGDSRFMNFTSRFENRDALELLMKEWINARPAADVIATFETADAAICRVLDIDQMVDDPHVLARESFIQVKGIFMQNVLARFDLTPGVVDTPGPPYSEEPIEWLRPEQDNA
jgi:crotonobetainyl-CoA:carnitine CoA-transferase CaiB-like acyl-CoA transferase